VNGDDLPQTRADVVGETGHVLGFGGAEMASAVEVPKLQPGREVFGLKIEFQMFDGHLASVHRRAASAADPKFSDLQDMRGPIFDAIREDGTDDLVLPHIGIKMVQQRRDAAMPAQAFVEAFHAETIAQWTALVAAVQRPILLTRIVVCGEPSVVKPSALFLLAAFSVSTIFAQDAKPALPAIPPPLSVPAPGPVTDKPYAPQAILQGGVVIPLYPEGSPFLKAERVREAEQYNMSRAVPGRISSIVNIHNPSIEVHRVEGGLNTGAAIILAAGGGHNTLNVAGESADFVPFFFNYGVNTIILRNRLRRDGYEPRTDAVNDAMQAIRLVRAHAKSWNIDPNKIGIMGFSAGAELATPPAVFFEEWDRTNSAATDPLAGVSARPDFVGVIYPGPTPYARGANPPVPRNAPPAFIVCPSSGDRIHALWANEYYMAMLNAGIPNIEMHLYGNGRHPGDELPDGTRMSGE